MKIILKKIFSQENNEIILFPYVGFYQNFWKLTYLVICHQDLDRWLSVYIHFIYSHQSLVFTKKVLELKLTINIVGGKT